MKDTERKTRSFTFARQIEVAISSIPIGESEEVLFVSHDNEEKLRCAVSRISKMSGSNYSVKKLQAGFLITKLSDKKVQSHKEMRLKIESLLDGYCGKPVTINVGKNRFKQARVVISNYKNAHNINFKTKASKDHDGVLVIYT